MYLRNVKHTSLRISKRFNTTIGFIGLGRMGSRMVNNLLQKTNPSTSSILVYDIYEPALTNATNKGAIQVSNPADMSSECDYIITCLRDDNQVTNVYNEIFTQPLKDNVLCIDSSTINYSTCINLSNQAPTNINLIDAPMSGGINAAEHGTLTFMLGGQYELYLKAKPILQYMGTKILHCGDNIGCGQIVKMCNNLLCYVTMCAVSESINLGEQMGINPQTLNDIINESTGRCWVTSEYTPHPDIKLKDQNGNIKQLPSANNYNDGADVEILMKDLRLALNAASSIGLSVPLTELTSTLYGNMISQHPKLKSKDFSIIYQLIKLDRMIEEIDKD